MGGRQCVCAASHSRPEPERGAQYTLLRAPGVAMVGTPSARGAPADACSGHRCGWWRSDACIRVGSTGQCLPRARAQRACRGQVVRVRASTLGLPAHAAQAVTQPTCCSVNAAHARRQRLRTAACVVAAALALAPSGGSLRVWFGSVAGSLPAARRVRITLHGDQRLAALEALCMRQQAQLPVWVMRLRRQW